MNCRLPEIVEVVARFVARTRGVDESTVEPTTQLLQEGLVDSFGLVELIVELESHLGTTLAEGTLLPEDFETPQVLFERLQQL
ncbi:MAG: phosphopantetheine-binding protein [Acidobacteria bacterium]|jgi:acyl carrier protein|nr:phosphopantetheine-binding protein [Acidobacteriota bacterium]